MNTIKKTATGKAGSKPVAKDTAAKAADKKQVVTHKNVAPAPVKKKEIKPAVSSKAATAERPAARKEHKPITLRPDPAKATDKKLKASTAIEDNYPAHQKNPDPAPEAVLEEDEDGAGKAMKWVIPAVVVGLVVLWFFMK